MKEIVDFLYADISAESYPVNNIELTLRTYKERDDFKEILRKLIEKLNEELISLKAAFPADIEVHNNLVKKINTCELILSGGKKLDEDEKYIEELFERTKFIFGITDMENTKFLNSFDNLKMEEYETVWKIIERYMTTRTAHEIISWQSANTLELKPGSHSPVRVFIRHISKDYFYVFIVDSKEDTRPTLHQNKVKKGVKSSEDDFKEVKEMVEKGTIESRLEESKKTLLEIWKKCKPYVKKARRAEEEKKAEEKEKTIWERNIALLKQYFDAYKTLDTLTENYIAVDFITGGLYKDEINGGNIELGKWFKMQKERYEKGKLPPEQAQEFEKLITRKEINDEIEEEPYISAEQINKLLIIKAIKDNLKTMNENGLNTIFEYLITGNISENVIFDNAINPKERTMGQYQIYDAITDYLNRMNEEQLNELLNIISIKNNEKTI